MKMLPCAAWRLAGDPTFTVRTRYLFFTHTVDLPWFLFGDTVLMRLPGGKPGHKGVTCAPGTTLANLPQAAPANRAQPAAGTIKGRMEGTRQWAGPHLALTALWRRRDVVRARCAGAGAQRVPVVYPNRPVGPRSSGKW